MKLEGYKDASYGFTEQVSNLVRQLAFAGVAIIWIFKYDKPNPHLIPIELILPLVFIVITLACDFLQYFFPAIIWTIFYRYYENKTDKDEDIKANPWLSAPGWLFFGLKVVGLIISYCYLAGYLIAKL